MLDAQHSEHVGMGTTSVDLREVAPRYRPGLRTATRQTYEPVINHDRFENLRPGDNCRPSWLKLFHELSPSTP